MGFSGTVTAGVNGGVDAVSEIEDFVGRGEVTLAGREKEEDFVWREFEGRAAGSEGMLAVRKAMEFAIVAA